MRNSGIGIAFIIGALATVGSNGAVALPPDGDDWTKVPWRAFRACADWSAISKPAAMRSGAPAGNTAAVAVPMVSQIRPGSGPHWAIARTDIDPFTDETIYSATLDGGPWELVYRCVGVDAALTLGRSRYSPPVVILAGEVRLRFDQEPAETAAWPLYSGAILEADSILERLAEHDALLVRVWIEGGRLPQYRDAYFDLTSTGAMLAESRCG